MVASPNIELGKLVSDTLRGTSSLDVRATMWWLGSDNDTWKFMVACGSNDADDPSFAYREIAKALRSLFAPREFSVVDVWAVTDSHPAIEAIRRFFGAGESNLRVTNCILDDILIKDAYIYWIGKRRAGIRRKKR